MGPLRICWDRFPALGKVLNILDIRFNFKENRRCTARKHVWKYGKVEYHCSPCLIIQNFIVISSLLLRKSPSFSIRAFNLNRNGRGVRPDNPSYSSREMGSSSMLWKEKAQRRREMASQSSRSAAGRPGQIRRLSSKVNNSFLSWDCLEITQHQRSNDHVPSRWRALLIHHNWVDLQETYQG